MNSEIRKLSIIAFAAALPLTVLAQSSSSSNSSASSSPNSSSSPSSSSSTSPSYTSPANTGSSSSSASDSARTGNSSSSMTSSTPSVSGSSLGSIQRVSDQSLDRQFTAKDLIGKEVYDNRDKRIGEIKDLVLDSSQFQQLASAIGSRESQTGTYGSSTVNGGSDTSSSSTGMNSSDRNSNRTSSSSANGMANTSAGAGATSMRTGPDYASMSSEPAAIISHGGLLGVGNNLLRVPLSQLNFDQNSRHITVNVSEQQLSSLPNPSDTTRSAAE